MMMIPSILINLRRLKRVLCPVFSQGSQCALSPAQQTSTISDLLPHEKIAKCYRKIEREIIDHNETNENPLIKNEYNPSELRPPCKNAQVEVVLL